MDAPSSRPLGKTRPGIVVSNTVQNERLDSVMVVPLSTRAPEIWPLRLRLEVAGLRDAFAVVPGIRQVSKTRLHDLVAQAPQAAVERLTAALHLYLDD